MSYLKNLIAYAITAAMDFHSTSFLGMFSPAEPASKVLRGLEEPIFLLLHAVGSIMILLESFTIEHGARKSFQQLEETASRDKK